MTRFLYPLLFSACVLSGFSASAQISAYTNFQRQFMVWEDGITRKIEYLLPLQYKIGRIAMPYMDNSRNFKIYYRGASTKINDGLTNSFEVSDNLITYMNAKALYVWEAGTSTKLTNFCEHFITGDSVVLYFEGVQKEYRAYYNGNIYPIEGFLAASNSNLFSTGETSIRISNDMEIAGGQLPSVKALDNIIAYVNYSNQFRIFYQGRIIDQEDYLISSFDLGENTVAYVDINRQFKVFHAGQTRVLDDFVPESYKAGEDLVAYIGNDNNFRIFYKDSIYDLGYFQPNYQVKDNIVAFEDATGYFKVFYKGQIYTLETYYPDPSEMVIQYNSLAYVNRANQLRLFTAGRTYDVANAESVTWRLDYDVLQYRYGANMYKVFFEGRTY